MKFASASHAALTKWTNYYTKSLGSTQQGQAAFALSHTSVVVLLRWLSLHYRESPEEPLRLRDWNPNLVFLKSEEAGEDLTILMLLWQWLTILVLEWNFWNWFFCNFISSMYIGKYFKDRYQKKIICMYVGKSL